MLPQRSRTGLDEQTLSRRADRSLLGMCGSCRPLVAPHRSSLPSRCPLHFIHHREHHTPPGQVHTIHRQKLTVPHSVEIRLSIICSIHHHTSRPYLLPQTSWDPPLPLLQKNLQPTTDPKPPLRPLASLDLLYFLDQPCLEVVVLLVVFRIPALVAERVVERLLLGLGRGEKCFLV